MDTQILNAMLASVASQAVEIAGGNQKGFSWKQMGLSAISAGVGAGMDAGADAGVGSVAEWWSWCCA